MRGAGRVVRAAAEPRSRPRPRCARGLHAPQPQAAGARPSRCPGRPPELPPTLRAEQKAPGSDLHHTVTAEAQSCGADPQRWDSLNQTSLFVLCCAFTKRKPAHCLCPQMEFLPMKTSRHIKKKKKKKQGEKERRDAQQAVQVPPQGAGSCSRCHLLSPSVTRCHPLPSPRSWVLALGDAHRNSHCRHLECPEMGPPSKRSSGLLE